MTDWSKYPWALDVSHWNASVDWQRIAAQKPACAFLKATERRVVDRTFDQHRKACANAGILWMPYVFMRPDDTDATVDFFNGVLGDTDVPVALDWEANGVSTAVVEMWIDGMENRNIIYYGLYPPAAVSDRIAEWPRWFPQYPGSPTADPRVMAWNGRDTPDWRKSWLLWQWTDKAAIAGVSGAVDLSRLAVSAERFATWCKTGEW